MQTLSTSAFFFWDHPKVLFWQAAQWNIPWAITMAASRVTLNNLLLESRSMYFRSIPDTHPPVSSREVIFPSYDSVGWEKGNLSTAAKEIPIRKIVSSDLIQLAPSVHALIASFDLNLTLLNELLQEADGDGADLRPAACDWLKKHPAVSWLQISWLFVCQDEIFAERTSDFLVWGNRWICGTETLSYFLELVLSAV